MIVTTQSGSIYHIGLLSKTWTRLSKSDESGLLRIEEGEFEEIGPVKIGMPLRMFCKPYNEYAQGRIIQTSHVTKIEEDNDNSSSD